MEPRSVTLTSFGSQWVQYSALYETPRTNTTATSALSQLYGILSDNVKRRRPEPPLGLVKSRRHHLKTNFVRDPKRHHYSKRLLKYATGAYSYVFGTIPETYPRYWYTGTLMNGQPLVTTEGDADLYARADKALKSKFFNKLKNSEFDLALTVAERAQTKVMIVRRAAILLNLKRWLKGLWKRIRQRSIQKHESIAVAMSNAWLEFKYGWLQIANDIFGIAAFSSSRAMSRFVKTRAMVGTVENKSRRDPSTGVSVVAEETRRIFAEMKIKVSIVADPVLDLTRLSTLNPIAIAWELVPLSFVFDWILNISQYLQELQTRCMFNSSLGTGYVTFTEVFELKGEFPAQQTKGTYQCYKIPQAIRFSDSWCRKRREPFGQAPLPVFPTMKSPLDLEHALTTLSLVVQRLKSSHLGRKAKFQ